MVPVRPATSGNMGREILGSGSLSDRRPWSEPGPPDATIPPGCSRCGDATGGWPPPEPPRIRFRRSEMLIRCSLERIPWPGTIGTEILDGGKG